MLDRWRRRFERAASLLSGRLDDPPSLAELASAAAVSPFHFHRIWRALTRETVGQTILRLRMEASHELLRVKDASVTETATAIGFGTPQSFARAFRRHTGRTPSEHRNSQSSVAKKDAADMKVAVDRRGEIMVVVLRREGKAYTDLNATFGEVWSWAEATDTLQHLQGIYGIPLDDPASVPVVTMLVWPLAPRVHRSLSESFGCRQGSLRAYATSDHMMAWKQPLSMLWANGF